MDRRSLIFKNLWVPAFIILLLPICCPDSIPAFEKTFTNSLGMEFVLIPSGTFVIGSSMNEAHRGSSETQHRVTISTPFYMQSTEVTVNQWRLLMGRKIFKSRRGPENRPVTKVSWFDAKKFIELLNELDEGMYRLPTEAEWEYAARAGSSTAFSWGDAIDCDKAMYGNKRRKHDECQEYIKTLQLELDQAAPVKSYSPNEWGLYDMHGNVWEWIMDRYGEYSSVPVVDPRGPASGGRRIRRGGSWFSDGASCRSANRSFGHPATRYQTTGFRVVREVQ